MINYCFAIAAETTWKKFGYVGIASVVIAIIASYLILCIVRRCRSYQLHPKRNSFSKPSGYGWCELHGVVAAGHRCDVTKHNGSDSI